MGRPITEYSFLPIDFSGWKCCERGEPEGDRVLDFFT
jgi:hypothetical protein